MWISSWACYSACHRLYPHGIYTLKNQIGDYCRFCKEHSEEAREVGGEQRNTGSQKQREF